MKPTLKQIEKKANLIGKIVRPLCGKILEPTIAEQQGLIQRDWLLDINGRSRAAQMKLADKFGLTEYASPAGGCLLTDPNYCSRLKDLFDNQAEYEQNDIYLLRHGRQFRLSSNAKLIVGRDETDNDNIEQLIKPEDHIFEAMDIGSPIGLLRGKPEQFDIELAAAITARYSDAKHEDSVSVEIRHDSRINRIEIKPADDAMVAGLRL
jgi:hypothetical protein